MKDFWQRLRLKIGRMGRKKFFLKHLYMTIFIGPLLFLLFCIIILGADGPSNGFLETLFMIGLTFSLIKSNFFLAKRFQDCGICGIRAFIIGIFFPIILISIGSYIESSKILSLIYPMVFHTYPIVLIIMCFVKGNPDPNKYGNPV